MAESQLHVTWSGPVLFFPLLGVFFFSTFSMYSTELQAHILCIFLHLSMSTFNKVKMYYPPATHDKRISIASECNALEYILFGLYFDAYSCMVGPTVHLACMQVHSAYIHLFMHCECIFLTTYEHIVKYFVCLHVECIMSTCKGMHSNPLRRMHSQTAF